MENQINNMEMYKNYRDNFAKLKRAISEKFYYEAIFLEYSIIEDRTESILRHADKWEACVKSQRGHRVGIDNKIKYIKDIAREKKSLAHRYFSDSLLDDVLEWKENRNKLIHALLKQNITDEEIAEIAITGERLTKEIRNRANNFTRAIERRNKKSATVEAE